MKKFDVLLLLLVFIMAIAVIGRDDIGDFVKEIKANNQVKALKSNSIDSDFTKANIRFTMDDAEISLKLSTTEEVKKEIDIKTSVDGSLVTCQRQYSEVGDAYLTFLYKEQKCTVTIAKQAKEEDFITVVITFAGEKPVKTKITSDQKVVVEVFDINTYICTISN